ncbi:phosphatase PAP2 family protein [Modicisalibacter coralii]|uniref:phosphatase PAP2 family protein n=1 Tax=Modicisalibacter coralii TaxID=2304602 RepID=UPI00100C05E2|nr:phosphatase PAP2 family protein [Halomonas coralii]
MPDRPDLFSSSPSRTRRGQAVRQLIVAWLIFAAMMTLFAELGVDFRLADLWYALEGGRWSLEHAWWTQRVLHDAGRTLSISMGAVLIVALVLSGVSPRWRRWRRPLGYLFLAVAASTLSVSLLKQTISMDCPWDLARYGGDRDSIGLFAARPADYPDTACFPAGHASAGYAWIALYFFFARVAPRWRRAGLAVGLGLGLAFGIAQQLRGAHFLSHDLWTLMICVTWSRLLALWLLPQPHPGHRFRPAHPTLPGAPDT